MRTANMPGHLSKKMSNYGISISHFPCLSTSMTMQLVSRFTWGIHDVDMVIRIIAEAHA